MEPLQPFLAIPHPTSTTSYISTTHPPSLILIPLLLDHHPLVATLHHSTTSRTPFSMETTLTHSLPNSTPLHGLLPPSLRSVLSNTTKLPLLHPVVFPLLQRHSRRLDWQQSLPLPPPPTPPRRPPPPPPRFPRAVLLLGTISIVASSLAAEAAAVLGTTTTTTTTDRLSPPPTLSLGNVEPHPPAPGGIQTPISTCADCYRR